MAMPLLLLGERSKGRPASERTLVFGAEELTVRTHLVLATSFSFSCSATSLARFSLFIIPFTRSSS